MKRLLLAVLSAAAIACAKSSETPEAKKPPAESVPVGPAAMDPRAAAPLLDKARKAAEQAAAKDAETANALSEIQ